MSDQRRAAGTECCVQRHRKVAHEAYTGTEVYLMREFAHHRYTWTEYLAFERAANTKSEFLDGEIFAMAGGTPQHAQLTLRVGRALGNQLEGKPCQPYSSDLRVRVTKTGLATYPDVSVVCGAVETDSEDKNTVTNPTVIVEVLSPSTEDYDRGRKFEHYREMSSLREYVLVSSRERLIEMFYRGAGTEWSRSEARPGGEVTLESIDCSLTVNEIYEGVALP